MSVPLLLRALHADAAESAATLQVLRADEWERLFDAAVFHELDALLFRRTAPVAAAAPPAAVLRALEERYGIHALRARLLEVQLRSLLQSLAAGGIPAVMLKGACLAWAVYDEPALRSMGDIDILVPRERLVDARDALTGLGYTSDDGPVAHHLPAMRKPGNTMVELHWTIELPHSPFTIDEQELWDGAVPVQVAGVPVLMLSPEHMLVHLSMHVGWHHRFGLEMPDGIALKHLYDISLLLQRFPALDWARVARTANAWGAGAFVYCTLGVMRRLYGVQLPAESAARLDRRPEDDELVELIAASFLEHPSMPAEGYLRLTRQRTAAGRLQHARRTLFPGLARVAEIYGLQPGSAAVWLRAVLRPLELAARYTHATAHVRLNTRTGRAVAGREALRREFRKHLAAYQRPRRANDGSSEPTETAG